MNKVIKTSRSGKYKLQIVDNIQEGSAFVIENVSCFGAYPDRIGYFPASHYCSHDSWERAALRAWKQYENI